MDINEIVEESIKKLIIEQLNIHNSFESAINELISKGISVNNKSLLNIYNLTSVTLSKRGNYVTLTDFMVKDRNGGYGTKFMNDLTKVADENGWILVLTPDVTFGASSVSRLKRFYKRFGFQENKGRNVDFRTRESMIRRPMR